MAEGKTEQPNDSIDLSDAAKDALAERELMRRVSIGLPIVTVVGAVAIGVARSFGPAILVLAGGGLLGVIMLLWSSLRILGGDAPLSPELVQAMVLSRSATDVLAEKKRMTLRALKDLEHEYAIGKMDEADYKELSGKLRAEAKAILQKMDTSLDDRRPEAERLAQAYLRKKGLSDGSEAPLGEPVPSADKAQEVGARIACLSCQAPNETDATFCKGCGARMAKTEGSP